MPTAEWTGTLGEFFTADPEKTWDSEDVAKWAEDESEYRLAFTRSGNGKAEEKIVQAINIFSDKQDEMEAMARQLLAA